MERIRDEIDSLLESIKSLQEVAGPSAIAKAEQHVEQADAQVVRINTAGGYRRFLIDHISTEQSKFRNGEREEPLCDCENPYCRLKMGKLPAKITEAESTDDGITRFRADHRGDASVLMEAQDAFVEETAEARGHLRKALAILRADERDEEIVAWNGADDEADADDETGGHDPTELKV